MKKLVIPFLFACLLSVFLVFSADASDYTPDSDGKYTVEIETGTPDTEFAIVIVAGDYTGKAMPELTAENIIYMNQVRSDSDGTVIFEDFIPMTGSVGTIYISGDTAAENDGILMTDSGLGYIAGKIISYTGEDEELVIPEGFTSVGDGVLDNASKVRRVFIPSGISAISSSAFGEGIKLFLSPKISDTVRQYAIDNGLTYYLLGDYNNDKTVDGADMQSILSHYAEGKSSDADFEYYFDLNFDGKVNLLDASVLLKYLGGVISDFFS